VLCKSLFLVGLMVRLKTAGEYEYLNMSLAAAAAMFFLWPMLQDMGVDENDTIIFLADSIGVVKKHLSTPAAPILFLILHPLVLDRPHSPH
jgi:hypothetical protein